MKQPIWEPVQDCGAGFGRSGICAYGSKILHRLQKLQTGKPIAPGARAYRLSQNFRKRGTDDPSGAYRAFRTCLLHFCVSCCLGSPLSALRRKAIAVRNSPPAAAVCQGYFLATTLFGLRLPMRPLSVPAFSSITALMRVGLPESIASFTARYRSSGEIARTPTPPKASIIIS